MEELKELNYINYKEQIKEFYKNFNIQLEVSKVIDSYSITRYFIKLDRTNKTRITNIEKLVDDLSVELGIKNIKFTLDFETGAIVLEIPKKERTMLYYKDIQNTNIDNTEGLQVCFGKDLNNNNFMVNLCQTPHLLIAGTTGSGKSMFINSILCNLINTYDENTLRLSLIDPKKVELSTYKGVKQVDEIADNLQGAKKILANALQMIDNRYKLLENNNCRNIINYNKKVDDIDKLPYKVIVIDELADIILQDKKTQSIKALDRETPLENLIVRIAQIGRACGVHLIVATQRPSTNVITGLIKANIPSRVAFSVSSKIDSRIILDDKGAEKLTGKGDMLVKIVGNDELYRLQGSYISDEEVEEIVKQHQSIDEITPVLDELNEDMQKQKLTYQLQNTLNQKIEHQKQIEKQKYIEQEKQLKEEKKQKILNILKVIGIVLWNIIKWAFLITFGAIILLFKFIAECAKGK